MKVIVNVVVKNENKVLMVKELAGNSKDMWNFPAGHLEEGENIFDGAIREAKEETGYDVKLTGFLGLQNSIYNNKHVLLVLFTAEIVGSQGEYNNKEISKVEFLDIDKVINMTDLELKGGETRRDTLKQLINNKVYPLDVVSNFDFRKI